MSGVEMSMEEGFNKLEKDVTLLTDGLLKLVSKVEAVSKKVSVLEKKKEQKVNTSSLERDLQNLEVDVKGVTASLDEMESKFGGLDLATHMEVIEAAIESAITEKMESLDFVERLLATEDKLEELIMNQAEEGYKESLEDRLKKLEGARSKLYR